MAHSGDISDRKEPRFRICDGQALACDTAVEDDEKFREGSVLDISSHGLRFLCHGAFEVGLAFSTELKTDRSHGVYCGVVRRVEPWVGGQHILGCELLEPIPSDVLEELAHAGIVNRRRDERFSWDQPASMSWELHPGEIQVEIRDYSPGGMRVYAEQSIPDNVRMRIRMRSSDEKAVVVSATSVWRSEDERGCHAGLAFSTPDPAELMSKVSHGSGENLRGDSARRRLLRPALALVAVALLSAACLHAFPAIRTAIALPF